MAVRAFALIQQQYPDASLTMAERESTDSDLCRALVHDSHVRNVHFIRQVPKAQIPALADQHDMHLHTNRVENMPVSIIEMWAWIMASATPVSSEGDTSISARAARGVRGFQHNAESPQVADAVIEAEMWAYGLPIVGTRTSVEYLSDFSVS